MNSEEKQLNRDRLYRKLNKNHDSDTGSESEQDEQKTTTMTAPVLNDVQKEEQRYLLREMEKINPFRGSKDCNLALFISTVEYFLNQIVLQENQIKATLIIHSKIQGEAVRATNSLPHLSSWKDIKVNLIRLFSIKETYIKLSQEIGCILESNTFELYKKLDFLLQKLQTKTQLEPNLIYTQANNEVLVFEAFKHNLNPSQKAIVIAYNCKNMVEAYETLEANDMIRVRNQSEPNRGFNTKHHLNNSPRQNQGHQNYNQNRFNQNNNNLRQQNRITSEQVRYNNNRIFGNLNPNHGHRFGFNQNYQRQSYNNNNNWQGQNNNQPSSSQVRRFNNNREQPMEVNRLSEQQTINEEVNFIAEGLRHFPS